MKTYKDINYKVKFNRTKYTNQIDFEAFKIMEYETELHDPAPDIEGSISSYGLFTVKHSKGINIMGDKNLEQYLSCIKRIHDDCIKMLMS